MKEKRICSLCGKEFWVQTTSTRTHCRECLNKIQTALQRRNPYKRIVFGG